jgi:hypothetical protein
LVTCKVVTSTLIDEHDATLVGGAASTPPSQPDVQFWHTSQGKFRFTLEELPAQLQLVYSLMNVRLLIFSCENFSRSLSYEFLCAFSRMLTNILIRT